MKINKFNEEMKTANFSDIKNWDVDKILQPKIKIGNKELDLVLGSKVSELFEKYELSINIGGFEWVKNQHLLLPDETNLIENRVEVGKKQKWEDFLDYNGYEYDKLSKKEKNDIDEEFEKRGFQYDPDIEFSVFLPENVYNLEYAALADASIYLKLLFDSKLKGVMNGGSDYNVFGDETEGVKSFLKLKKIKITNDNIEDIVTVSNRLYKDSKVFSLFKEELGGEHVFNNFFNEWLSLIK